MSLIKMPDIITRLSEPTYLDQSPKGTRCKVYRTSDTYDLYEQVSPEEDDVIWVHLGEFKEEDNG